ncbi:hypothetical protein BDF19DRAFT_438638 [Syncephalis fuscata]|nr:hypothetical protein BDF19DRAFT_438638 [Syncephalis fuscata]
MEQFAIMSNRLATLEGNSSITNCNIMSTQPATFANNPTISKNSMMSNTLTPGNISLSNTSTTQSNKTFVSTLDASPLETRVANLETFQYRLETFYLSSDLLKDTSFN